MATHVSRNDLDRPLRATSARVPDWVAPVGRALFALPLLFLGLNHFNSGTIGYAASSGVPLPNLLVPASGVLLVAGALSILLGFRTRLGAAAVIAFLVPVTFMMHAFWNVTDPMGAMTQQVMFLKNVVMLGGALFFLHQGAGPLSLDARQGK